MVECKHVIMEGGKTTRIRNTSTLDNARQPSTPTVRIKRAGDNVQRLFTALQFHLQFLGMQKNYLVLSPSLNNS